MLYRYELSLDGEKQDVGFMVGISEIDGLEEGEMEELTNAFDKTLPFPTFYRSCINKEKRNNTKAFFTKFGNSFFKNDINKLIGVFKERSCFDVDLILLDETKEQLNIVYMDEYQCLVEI